MPVSVSFRVILGAVLNPTAILPYSVAVAGSLGFLVVTVQKIKVLRKTMHDKAVAAIRKQLETCMNSTKTLAGEAEMLSRGTIAGSATGLNKMLSRSAGQSIADVQRMGSQHVAGAQDAAVNKQYSDNVGGSMAIPGVDGREDTVTETKCTSSVDERGGRPDGGVGGGGGGGDAGISSTAATGQSPFRHVSVGGELLGAAGYNTEQYATRAHIQGTRTLSDIAGGELSLAAASHGGVTRGSSSGGDGAVTAKSLFLSIDKDANGTLELNEFFLLMERMNVKISEKRAMKIFARCDRGGKSAAMGKRTVLVNEDG